ncbi:MAG: DUF115 domain-containing protein [Candidatus Altiarchaeales archaeon]|nr:DUF115 domain-containing protein [Candidatus Altiarchaeales archaeon]MBD3416929.1 DUF115 domain-containing protein [Candidatus Altiarchaeales archaeon]
MRGDDSMPWTHDYLEVVRALDLNLAEDRRSTLILDRMLKKQDLKPVEDLIRNRTVIVYGCGPSLENDLNKIWEAGIHKRSTSVAVDGAAHALLQYKIVPHINVTDLDGDLNSIVAANHYGSLTMVHAHADNIRAIVGLVPKLKGTVYGTTHSEPTEKVHNFGGFTDGDRAVYIVEHFKPRFIVLAGMDFGHLIGRFSGHYDAVKKPRGLRMGKYLIEELAGKSRTRILNVTSSGENIKNTKQITVERLRQIV